MSSVEHRPSASALCNGDFILIETNSGRGRMQTDPDAPQHLLRMDAPDDEIGTAVLLALSRSRQIALEEIATFFDLERNDKLYAEWIIDLMHRYGYKTKRALFKDMMNVSIRLEKAGATIRFTPMRHEALEAWGREKGDGIEDVIVSAVSSPAEIGAGFRVALERCR